MKLTRTTWIVLIVGILIIAAGSLGWIYSQQVDRQTQLNSQLILTKKQLSNISLDSLNLQKDQTAQLIDRINTTLAAKKTLLESPQDSIDATDSILSVARDSSVYILSMTSPGTSSEQLAGTQLNTLSVDLTCSGSINDVANFAINLNERFPSSLITLLQISRTAPPASTPTPTPAPTPTPGPPTGPPGFTPIVLPPKDFQGVLSLVIYNYKGN